MNNKEYWENMYNYDIYIVYYKCDKQIVFKFLGFVNIYVYKEIKNFNIIFGVL